MACPSIIFGIYPKERKFTIFFYFWKMVKGYEGPSLSHPFNEDENYEEKDVVPAERIDEVVSYVQAHLPLDFPLRREIAKLTYICNKDSTMEWLCNFSITIEPEQNEYYHICKNKYQSINGSR